MIDSGSNSDSNADAPDAVGLLADDFLRLHRERQNPNIEDYCIRFPELAERIRTLFPTILAMEQCGESKSGETSPVDANVKNLGLPQRIGDYQIIREIGRGGMGVVYEAEQQSLGRRVALKVLPSNALLSSSTIERFRRESRAAARLHHSNIVPVFGVGEENGLHYYVMQYIEGVGLDQVMIQLVHTQLQQRLDHGIDSLSDSTAAHKAREERAAALNSIVSSADSHSSGSDGRVYWHRFATIGVDLAKALHFAHLQGVLHRDVKPANVLLDRQGQPWLTDFGLAHVTDDANLTRSGDIVGTLRYLAPERLRGECSQQSDVYGLGITLYELATLTPAYAETDRATLIRQISQQSPKRPRFFNRHIPRDLETIIIKAIEKESSQRYRSAEELANDLSRFLNDLPIQARRVVFVEQVWRWCRRNPALAVLNATVCFLLFGLALAWGTISWVQGDRDRAQIAQKLADEARLSAARAEQVAQSQSHLAQAIGYRHGSLPDRKSKSLEEIRIALEFDPPAESLFALRNEAIAALAQTGVRYGQPWNVWNEDEPAIVFDRCCTRFARANAAGTVMIASLSDGREIARLNTKLAPIRGMLMSPSGNYIGISAEDVPVEIWDVSKKARAVGPIQHFQTAEFSADERSLAVCQLDAAVHFYNLERGTEASTLLVKHVPLQAVYSPDESRLAVLYREQSSVVHVFNCASGSLEAEIVVEGGAHNCNWHPDGNRIALACSEPDNVEIWDLQRGERIMAMEGHTQRVTRCLFTEQGDYLASNSWDGSVRVWEPQSGDQVVVLNGGALVHAGEGSVLGLRLEDNMFSQVELDPAIGFDRLTSRDSKHKVQYDCGATSPDGRLLVCGTYDGLELWDLADHRRLAQIEHALPRRVFFDPSGSSFYTASASGGLQQWSISSDDFGWRLEQPTLVENGDVATDDACATPDGRLWASIGRGKSRVLTSTGQIVCEILAPPNHDKIQLSPDGMTMASYGWHSPILSVWNAHTGKQLKEFRCEAQALAGFTPDSQQLIICQAREFRFFDLNNWDKVRTIARHGCTYPSNVAYSPRGDLVALELTWGVLHLLRTDNFETVALLESPTKNQANSFNFCAGGSLLCAFHIRSTETYVWNIDEMRQQLALLHLDWDGGIEPTVVSRTHENALPNVPRRLEISSRTADAVERMEIVRQQLQAAEKRLGDTP